MRTLLATVLFILALTASAADAAYLHSERARLVVAHEHGEAILRGQERSFEITAAKRDGPHSMWFTVVMFEVHDDGITDPATGEGTNFESLTWTEHVVLHRTGVLTAHWDSLRGVMYREPLKQRL